MKGTSVIDFFDRFPNEQACLQHLVDRRWLGHTGCPRCGKLGRWSPIRGTRKYQHACRALISPTEGTIFYRSNLPLMAWFYALLLNCNSCSGVRARFVKRQLGIGVRSAHALCNKLRMHLAAQARPEKVGGPGQAVYVDETLLTRVVTGPPRQAANAIAMGFSCNGQVVTGIIRNRRRQTIVQSIERFVERGSTLVTDGHGSYRCLEKLGWDHIVVDHSKAFHNFEGETTNPIECYWPHLKRALRRYHQVGKENLWLFLAETEYRYNRRHSAISPFDEAVSSFPEVSAKTLPNIRKRFVWP